MLRGHGPAVVLARLASTLPSTSTPTTAAAHRIGFQRLHTSASCSSTLPNVKPLEEELSPSSPSPSFSSPSHRPSIFHAPPVASTERKRPAKKEVGIIVNDDNIRQWVKMEPRGLASAYLQLSKSKLTLLITSTAAAGYLMGPGAIDWVAFTACCTGTALLSSAANACNQLLEAPYDAQMKRTQSRVLVVHRFSPLHAFAFAGVSATAGTALLLAATNPLTAALGLLNVGLYAGVYTPMKRISIASTWAGAVVGAIPPLMGYAAASGTIDMASMTLAAILYSWQFPHFNGLSWNLRGDYSKAGYRVMCVTDEALCRRTSIRHSLALVGMCSIAAPLTDLTTWTFAADTLPVNGLLVYLSYRFYRAPDAKNSRQLFFFSLLYLPLIMILGVMSNGGRTREEKTRKDKMLTSEKESLHVD